MITRILLFALLMAGGAFAQERMGRLRVEVQDPAGNVIAASGKLLSLSTGASREFRTDAQGQQTLTDLPFGRYRLEVSAAGFAAQTILVDVQSAAPQTRRVTLGVGELAFKVDVVATTPLPGVNLEPKEIPAPVQAATARDLEQSGALSLSDFMNRRLSGVHINEIQGNPFQPDVNYRGYTASPLLGTPQGLSIYMDGVRMNQPFGDVVSWDLIPRVAIAEMAIMPGSNPLFGLNTLGGALSLQTKDGHSHHGTSLQANGGSFGRATADLEHGGYNAKGWNWYLGGTLFFEDGWRDNSPSNVRQVFGKIGRQGERTSLTLTTSYASNLLTGNALQEQRFLDRDYASVYTKPDVTGTQSPFVNLTGRHSFNANWALSGNAYFRYIHTSAISADINEGALDQSIYQPSAADRAALAAAGYTGFPTSGATAANTPFPFWRCIAQGLQRDEPAEKCNGLLNRTSSLQRNYGLSAQVSWTGAPRDHRNQFTAGGGWDGNRAGFRQSTQLGYLNPDRSITGIQSFGDGVTGGTVDGEPFDTRVDLRGVIHTASVFATDTLALTGKLTLTVSGRYNHTRLDNRDQIRPAAGPGSLTGAHSFDRLNPAIGLTFTPWDSLNAYVSYTEGSRAPTSIELGCADPNEPCKLPNALAGDPPLLQVVTRTMEAGVRGGTEGKWSWSAGWFRADNRQDILFVASEQTGFGYFKNFGRTLRDGLKLDATGQLGRASVGASYTFLDATFQSPETVTGSSNSASDAAAKGLDGNIHILPGARIPLIPQHQFKAFADLRATGKFSLALDVIGVSSAYARGNENNLHQPDGIYYLGSGRSPGYAVANFGARYQLTQRLQVFVQVNNLADRRYFTAAQLGPTGFTAAGTFIARPFAAVNGAFPVVHATFYAPGAPRGAWAGLKLRF